MSRINQLLTIALGLFLISAGVAKFAGGHVFQYIEHRSGIDLFHPYVNHVTGFAEIGAGAMLLVRRTRLVGAVAAAGLMLGAIAFHLSPWLGLSVPTGLTEGAMAPWDAGDFASATTPVTFVLAVVTAVRAMSIIRTERSRRRSVSEPGAAGLPTAAAGV